MCLTSLPRDVLALVVELLPLLQRRRLRLACRTLADAVGVRRVCLPGDGAALERWWRRRPECLQGVEEMHLPRWPPGALRDIGWPPRLRSLHVGCASGLSAGLPVPDTLEELAVAGCNTAAVVALLGVLERSPPPRLHTLLVQGNADAPAEWLVAAGGLPRLQSLVWFTRPPAVPPPVHAWGARLDRLDLVVPRAEAVVALLAALPPSLRELGLRCLPMVEPDTVSQPLSRSGVRRCLLHVRAGDTWDLRAWTLAVTSALLPDAPAADRACRHLELYHERRSTNWMFAEVPLHPGPLAVLVCTLVVGLRVPRRVWTLSVTLQPVDGRASVSWTAVALLDGVLQHPRRCVTLEAPCPLGAQSILHALSMAPATSFQGLRLLRLLFQEGLGLNDHWSAELLTSGRLRAALHHAAPTLQELDVAVLDPDGVEIPVLEGLAVALSAAHRVQALSLTFRVPPVRGEAWPWSTPRVMPALGALAELCLQPMPALGPHILRRRPPVRVPGAPISAAARGRGHPGPFQRLQLGSPGSTAAWPQTDPTELGWRMTRRDALGVLATLHRCTATLATLDLHPDHLPQDPAVLGRLFAQVGRLAALRFLGISTRGCATTPLPRRTLRVLVDALPGCPLLERLCLQLAVEGSAEGPAALGLASSVSALPALRRLTLWLAVAAGGPSAARSPTADPGWLALVAELRALGETRPPPDLEWADIRLLGHPPPRTELEPRLQETREAFRATQWPLGGPTLSRLWLARAPALG